MVDIDSNRRTPLLPTSAVEAWSRRSKGERVFALACAVLIAAIVVAVIATEVATGHFTLLVP